MRDQPTRIDDLAHECGNPRRRVRRAAAVVLDPAPLEIDLQPVSGFDSVEGLGFEQGKPRLNAFL